jgi:hypothetical protein
MEEVNIPVKYDGAVYKLKDPFRVYTCPVCQMEAAQKAQKSIKKVMIAVHMNSFMMWDDGESPGDWFEYVGEYEDMDSDVKLLKFFE